jgi:hypothetical protein
MKGRLDARVAKLEGRHRVRDYAAMVRRMTDEDLVELHAIFNRQAEREKHGEPWDPADSAAAARITARYR